MQFSLRLNLKRDPSLVYTYRMTHFGFVCWWNLCPSHMSLFGQLHPPQPISSNSNPKVVKNPGYFVVAQGIIADDDSIMSDIWEYFQYLWLTRESSSNYEKPSSVLRKCPALTAHSHPNNICQSRQLSVKYQASKWSCVTKILYLLTRSLQ